MIMKKFKFGKGVDEKIKSLIKKLPKGSRVLDLGAGLGGNSIFLAEQGFKVTCLDKDKEVIDFIKKEYPKINALNKDILEFDFNENEYDLIIARAILHFFILENINVIMNRIIKSLKKNGLFYFIVTSVNDSNYGKIKNRHFFSKEELERIFSKNMILEMEEKELEDDHPPIGKHIHKVIKGLVRK